jgi:hypothetical protein
MFERSSPPGARQGTGLGLALVRAIVADHGGAVRVRSTPGAGTQVDVFLPLLGSVAAESMLAANDSPRGDGRIVMVVDDDRAVLEMTEEMLAHLGYEPVGYDTPTARRRRCARIPTASTWCSRTNRCRSSPARSSPSRSGSCGRTFR